MEKNHLDEICCTLLRTSKVVVRHISPIKPFPVPYSDEKCRKMLYDTLLACSIYSDPLQSKCIVEAQNIFNAASRDTSTKVKEFVTVIM
ncbi:hypothetical protein AVEN_68698-1 [Araneus ventricosus]|uniref:Uncharacterized protein n=1 Tax=Araneus ventricosus TaxID=182803 RepID=A0A4Y2M3W6_ARAVE|nr:hypothetical protein AVEN_68698-1 [Araneus ventricosus]